MFHGTTIDELIATVEQAEQHEQFPVMAKPPVKVTRYEAKHGFIYAMQFGDAAFAGVA